MLSGFYARVQTHVRIVEDEPPYWRGLEAMPVTLRRETCPGSDGPPRVTR